MHHFARTLDIDPHWIYDKVNNGTIQITKDVTTPLYLFPDKPATLGGFKLLIKGNVKKLNATEDDVALLWLNDQTKTNDVVAKLNANKAQAHIDTVLAGAALQQYFNDPTKDSRTPDIVVLPQHGVIYASLTATKIAEHGGFSADDTHVALFVSNPHLNKGSISTAVHTTQIAPTILHLLGLDPNQLQAVGMEQTHVLPGL